MTDCHEYFFETGAKTINLEWKLPSSTQKQNPKTMKALKLLLMLVLTGLIVNGPVLSASRDKKADRKLTKEIKKKAVRQARKEARRFRRGKWYVAPGALPMDKQVQHAWELQYMNDDKGYPLYIVATGNSVAETQSAAKLQAMELAKLELAGLVQSNIAALVENSVANNQLNRDDAETVTKTVAASKNVIAQEIGRVIPFFEIYRKAGKGKDQRNIECSVRIGYNSEMAMEAAKQVVRKKLEDETRILHEKLDKLLDF